MDLKAVVFDGIDPAQIPIKQGHMDAATSSAYYYANDLGKWVFAVTPSLEAVLVNVFPRCLIQTVDDTDYTWSITP